jgi:hypothetical protein
MTQADHVRHIVLAALSRRTQWSLRSFRLAVDSAINEAGITRRGLAKALGLSLSMVARAVDVTDQRISCVRAVAKALGYDASDDQASAVFRRRTDTIVVPPVPHTQINPDTMRAKEIVVDVLGKEPPMTPRRFAQVLDNALTVNRLTRRHLAVQCDIAATTVWAALIHNEPAALVTLAGHLGYAVDGGGMFRRATR